MEAETNNRPYLTAEQVRQLNEKHGWFEYGDAQSDVSRAFAQDAVAMHERIRAAAPDLLGALEEAKHMFAGEYPDHPTTARIFAAIAKATGSAA